VKLNLCCTFQTSLLKTLKLQIISESNITFYQNMLHFNMEKWKLLLKIILAMLSFEIPYAILDEFYFWQYYHPNNRESSDWRFNSVVEHLALYVQCCGFSLYHWGKKSSKPWNGMSFLLIMTFLLAVFNSFYCTSLLNPWLSLFLSILSFLMLLWMGSFS
jgi:hypothetical protein